MATWWRLEFGEITPVNVRSATDRQVVLEPIGDWPPRRALIHARSHWSCYHPTWEGARAELKAQLWTRLQNAEHEARNAQGVADENLARARAAYEAAEKMEPPKESQS